MNNNLSIFFHYIELFSEIEEDDGPYLPITCYSNFNYSKCCSCAICHKCYKLFKNQSFFISRSNLNLCDNYDNCKNNGSCMLNKYFVLKYNRTEEKFYENSSSYCRDCFFKKIIHLDLQFDLIIKLTYRFNIKQKICFLKKK